MVIKNKIELSVAGALKRARQQLALFANEAKADAEILLAHALDKNRAYLIAHNNDMLEPKTIERYFELINRRELGEPIAYITGQREFYGLPLLVNSSVLIPRHETELLVDLALTKLSLDAPSLVLDLGTGSGAIALALAHERRLARVFGIDASARAVSCATQNAVQLALKNVQFMQSDWFSGFSKAGWGNFPGQSVDEIDNIKSSNQPDRHDNENTKQSIRMNNFSELNPLEKIEPKNRNASDLPILEKFDLIVSNPPYIERGDLHLVQGDCRFEPPSALIGGDDGLEDIRIIIATARHYLKPNAWLMIEHGYDQAAKIVELFTASRYLEVQTYKDIGSQDRITMGQFVS